MSFHDKSNIYGILTINVNNFILTLLKERLTAKIHIFYIESSL